MKKRKIVLRVLTGLAGLMLLALSAGLLGEAFFGFELTQPLGQLLAKRGFAVVLPVLLTLVVAALGIGCIASLIPEPKQKFVMQKAEDGRIGISRKSIEGLVRTCVQKHDRIANAEIKVRDTRHGLVIRLDVEQAAGMNIPLAVGMLQKQIRQYVMACTGVDVHEVRVMVENNEDEAGESPYAVQDVLPGALLTSTPVAPAAATLELPEISEPEIEQPVFEVPVFEAPVFEASAVEETAAEEAPEEEVTVEDVLSELDAALLPEITPVEETLEEDERPLHQRLFGTEEQPVTVPAPPELTAEPAPVEEVPAEASVGEADEASADETEAEIEIAEEVISDEQEEIAEASDEEEVPAEEFTPEDVQPEPAAEETEPAATDEIK